jgi:hypothetical protein
MSVMDAVVWPWRKITSASPSRSDKIKQSNPHRCRIKTTDCGLLPEQTSIFFSKRQKGVTGFFLHRFKDQPEPPE